MKTFKLVTFSVLKVDEHHVEHKEIPLDDGLIINKEDGKNNWLIEALIDRKYLDFFQEAHKNQRDLQILATISIKTNSPAAIKANIFSITEFGDRISILLDGIMQSTRTEAPEIVLSHLMDSGFQGEHLLKEFKDKMEKKRVLRSSKI